MATTTSPSGPLPDGRSGNLSAAFERVAEEQRLISKKQRAYIEFRNRIEEISPAVEADSPTQPSSYVLQTPSSTPGAGEKVIQAFTEELGPFHDTDLTQDDELVEALEEELTPELTENLVSAITVNSFPAALKTAILQVAARRENALTAIQHALSLEEESLRAVETDLAMVTDVVEEHRDTSLYRLQYDELQALRDELAMCIRLLDASAASRQADIYRTSEAGGTTIAHQNVVESCYDPLSPTYPALDAIATLTRTCRSAKETVESHLIYGH